MILEHLRTQTRSSHQALEKLLIPRLKNISDKKEYAKLLAIFYGYFFPLEQLINDYLDNRSVPDFAERRKADALLQDYAAVAPQSEPISICDDLPQITNDAEAMAALYVLEGSTLGGRIITQMLVNNTGIRPEEGIRFFSGYRENTELMWQRFIKALDTYSDDEAIHRSMAQTADDTFLKFKNWIALH